AGSVLGDQVAVTVRDGFEIRAGTEVPARAGEYGDVDPVVAVEGHERGPQRLGGGTVDRVASFGSVDGDHTDPATVLDVYRFHGCSSSVCRMPGARRPRRWSRAMKWYGTRPTR